MGEANMHYFQPSVGRASTKKGLVIPQLALCAPASRPSEDGAKAEPQVLKTGRGLFLGRARGVLKVKGEPHLILHAAADGKPAGDDIRAVWSSDEGDPRIVKNPVTGLETAVEGSIVKVGPRQYQITSRRQDDGAHIIQVRTGLPRQKGQSLDEAIKLFFAHNPGAEFGFHGSYALEDSGAEQVEGAEVQAGSEVQPEHLKWNVPHHSQWVSRDDNLRVPMFREDVWRIPEGCAIVIVDPSIDENGHQRTFVIRVENGQLMTRFGGKRERERFLELEIRRRKKRSAESARHTSSQGEADA